MERLTISGRLLLIFTIVGCGAFFFFCFIGTVDELPAGRYPVFIWLAPVGVVGLFFFLFAAFALQKLGVRIYRKP